MTDNTGLSLFLFGYSGHALSVADCIPKEVKLAGYFDVHASSKNPLDLTYFGNEATQDLNQIIQANYAFPSVGDNTVRKRILQLFRDHNLRETTLLHTRAYVSKMSRIGLSSMVGANAVVNANSLIGDGVIINTGAIIEHDCTVADYCHIAPGAVIAGNVQVGSGTFVGANSTIKQGVQIGSDVIIGAGSVVLTDINDGETWYGSPAKKR